MAQLPYELMDMIRNGGQPALAGGQQLPYALLDPIQNGGMPVLYQPKPSRIIPGMVSPFAPIAEPQAGDIPDQRARAQRYMRGQDTPVASNATDFPVQQGALYRPGDETLSTTPGGVESPAQAYADNLYSQGKNYPTGMPQPWNMPGTMSPPLPGGIGVQMEAQQPDTTPVDMPRQMPASPSVGIPQPSVAFNAPQESGVAGNNYTSGSTTSNTQQGALSQPQQQPESNAMMMGLLAAGLGILANNSGNYGAAGPAIGKGGLMGVQTYLSQKKQEQEMAMAQAQMAEAKRLHDAQIGNYQSEGQKRQAEVDKMKMDQKATEDYNAAVAQILQGQNPDQIAKMWRDPATHYKLSALLQSKNPQAAEMAAKRGMELEKQQEGDVQVVDLDVGNNKVQKARVNKKTGQVELLGQPNDKFNPNPLVVNDLKMNNFVPASEEAQKQYIQETRTSYNALKSAPFVLGNIEKAKSLAQTAYVGSGADTKKNIVKFFNNNLGTNIDSEAVASTEELKSRLFTQIMENLRKMDAQPTERQQNLMQEALGNIENDPKALPRVLDVMGEIVRQKVSVHNKDVQSAIDRGVKFPYNPIVEIPPQAKTVTRTGTYQGKKVIEYSDGSVEFAQ